MGTSTANSSQPSLFARVKASADNVKVFLDLAASLVVVIGFPTTFYQIRAARVEAHTHALETHEQVYSGLDAQYTEFLKLCLNDPKLDCFDVPEDPPPDLDDSERSRQRILYAALIPVLEHAYLAYHGDGAKEIEHVTQTQWPGWQLYARNFMRRPAFREVWNKLHHEFDSDFSTCMDSLSPTTHGPEAHSCVPYDGFVYPSHRTAASK
jgi:hypothetical protein